MIIENRNMELLQMPFVVNRINIYVCKPFQHKSIKKHPDESALRADERRARPAEVPGGAGQAGREAARRPRKGDAHAHGQEPLDQNRRLGTAATQGARQRGAYIPTRCFLPNVS